MANAVPYLVMTRPTRGRNRSTRKDGKVKCRLCKQPVPPHYLRPDGTCEDCAEPWQDGQAGSGRHEPRPAGPVSVASLRSAYKRGKDYQGGIG